MRALRLGTRFKINKHIYKIATDTPSVQSQSGVSWGEPERAPHSRVLALAARWYGIRRTMKFVRFSVTCLAHVVHVVYSYSELTDLVLTTCIELRSLRSERANRWLNSM